MMGVSFVSALVGLLFVATGVVLLVLRRYKQAAVALLIVGSLFIVVPFSLIYFLFD